MADNRTAFIHKFGAAWRKQLLMLCTLFVVLITVTEAGVYLIRVRSELLHSTPSHIIGSLIMPFCLNVLVLGLAFVLTNSKRLSEMARDLVLGLAVFFFCANAMITHCTYPPALATTCIAIFVSIVFASSWMTNIIFVLSLMCLGFSTFFSIIRGFGPTNSVVYAIIALALHIASYIGTRVAVSYLNKQINDLTKSTEREKKLFEELSTDGLMGIYNRKAMDAALVLHEQQKDSHGYHVLIVDLDHFKSINDTYGHQQGDVVLRAAADLLKNYSSDQINAYRYGGEEIVVIFEDMEFEEVLALANEIREVFSEIRFDFAPERMITLSGGLACVDKAWPLENWVGNADEALYQAKNTGRNKIVVYSEKA